MAKPELDILRGDDPWDRAVAAGVALVLIMLFGTVSPSMVSPTTSTSPCRAGCSRLAG
jgi:hypothetical protein